jgi:hypothetical protein
MWEAGVLGLLEARTLPLPSTTVTPEITRIVVVDDVTPVSVHSIGVFWMAV